MGSVRELLARKLRDAVAPPFCWLAENLQGLRSREGACRGISGGGWQRLAIHGLTLLGGLRFNAMVENGVDTEFGRFGPGKSHQPKKITTPPFYAVQYYPVTRKSMGGVVIDTSCRVLDPEQRTIPGLYAAGEVTGLAGINGKAGLEGTFLGLSIITGRVAGRTVLKDLGRKPGPGTVTPRPIDPPVKPDPLASTSLCLSCHDLPKLIAQPRPGYWHFEKVHREVVTTKPDCTQCHAELTPTFVPGKHRIDRLAQVQNCATCHKGEER